MGYVRKFTKESGQAVPLECAGFIERWDPECVCGWQDEKERQVKREEGCAGHVAEYEQGL